MDFQLELLIQTKLMKFLKDKLVTILLLIVSNALGQDTDIPSKLKSFEGIWQFAPPVERQNEFDFIAFDLFSKSNRITVYFEQGDKTVHSIGPIIVGFLPTNIKISKLTELQNVGQQMWFYTPNPKAPNDSIKYYKQASPNCFASFNGLGTDNFDPPEKGKPNYFLFNFNGREYERHIQLQHLPNYVLLALLKNKKELQKVEQFLNKKYQQIKVAKSYIFNLSMLQTKAFLIKGDPIEVLEQKGNWIRIRYYGKKTIEGWVKKEDVE